ncbi:MAG: metal-dependent hydrolase [Candidatus Woesearchaeota archaeon]|nr:MAG: metal-dependent hydrolase [Candidatus Woesearchaeota archaeon]
MPLAVTHVILTIIIVDLLRDYVIKKHKRYITLHTLFIAGIGGILPDIDIALGWLYSLITGTNTSFHGGFTHTPLFGLIFLIPGLILWYKGKHRYATYFFVLTFGVLFHISLDLILGGGAYEGIMLFWPISTATFKIHLLKMVGVVGIPSAIDGIILLLWLWHEEYKHKISDFI